MAIRDKINPLSFKDDKAFFNNDLNKWVLKLDYANHRSGLDLIELWRSEENAEWFLEMLSTVVYANIMNYKRLEDVEKFTYLLNNSIKYRNNLIESMVDAVSYAEAGGGFLIAYETGVNLQEMKELKMSIEQSVSSITKSIIEKSGLGVRTIPIDISYSKSFDNLDGLLDFLVDKDYLDIDNKLEIESINDIENDYRFKCYYDLDRDVYYFKRTGGEKVWQETETS